MRTLFRLSTVLLLLAAGGCFHATLVPESSDCIVGRTARFDTLVDLDGRSVHLSTLVQDRVEAADRWGRPELTVDGTDFLLLIASKTDCAWTRRFLSGIAAERKALESVKCRCALVLVEEEGSPAEGFREFIGPRMVVLIDRLRKCYDYYVGDKLPSLILIDRSGRMVLKCDGYLTPSVLINKIKAGDFSDVEAEGG